jgi:hypothetical protein
MKTLAVLTLGFVAMTGCESGQDVKFQQAQRHLADTAKAQLDGLQWKIDDEVATHIFSESRYLTFRKCHEEAPTHLANQKLCADLQARVTKQEAQDGERARKEKAAW